MDKANTALRRNCVRLRSLNSGNSELNLIISELGEVKSTFKKFAKAQKQAWHDMSSWASRESNLAVLETFNYLSELNDLWYEVQREFMGGIKSLQHQFEIILESETLLNKSRLHLASCEQKESKLSKELKKSEEHAPYKVIERTKLANDLRHATETVRAAQHEVSAKAVENETLKNNKIKEGMVDVSETFIELADKMLIVFSAHKEVTQCLPSVAGIDIQDIKYTGSETSKGAVNKAKEEVHCYKRRSSRTSAPPPYTSPPSSPLRSDPPSFANISSNSCPTYTNVSQHFYSEIPTSPPVAGFNLSSGAARYDLPPRENYENLPGIDESSGVAGASWNRFNPEL